MLPEDPMRKDKEKRGWQDRLVRHARNVNRTMSGQMNSLEYMGHWFYFIIKILTAVLTLYETCQFFVIVGQVMFTDTMDLSVFVTNTYFSTFDYTNNATWQVVVNPDWSGEPIAYSSQQNTRLYSCMWVAQVGGQPCSGYLGSVTQYQTCLQSTTPLYAGVSPNTLLTQCTTLNSYSPADTAYWPTTSILVNCITNNFNLSRWQTNSFKTCLLHDLPPLYEVAQDVDTPLFLGAFSWPLILQTGMAIFTAFAWYTFYPVDFEDVSRIELGKPRSSFSRMGMAWLGVPLVISVIWFVFVLMIAFRASNTWPNANNNPYPSTQQTNVVITTSAVVLFFYYLLELCESGDNKLLQLESEAQAQANEGEGEAKGELVFAPQRRVGLPQMIKMNARKNLGYYFPVKQGIWSDEGIYSAAEMYVPVLTQTWSDAYLADALVFTGAVGATLQGTTADYYNLFWGILYYRLTHMAIARLVYHAYVRSPAENSEENDAKEYKPAVDTGAYTALATTRLFAFSLHLAALLALSWVCYIIYDGTRIYSEYPLLIALLWAGFLIPEFLRFFGHILLAAVPVNASGVKGSWILVFTQFLWFWDLFVRTLIVGFIFWGLNMASGENGTRGTKPYLLDRFYSLQTMVTFTQWGCPYGTLVGASYPLYC